MNVRSPPDVQIICLSLLRIAVQRSHAQYSISLTRHKYFLRSDIQVIRHLCINNGIIQKERKYFLNSVIHKAMGIKRQFRFTLLQLTINNKDKMYKIMLFVFFFSCCFAQEETTVHQVDNIIPGEEIMDLSSEGNPSSEDRNNVGDILRELGAELNKDLRQTISDILADILDMKDKMEEMADTKVKLEQTRAWMMRDLKQMITEIQANITKNSDTLYDVNSTISNVKSTIEKNSAQITSVSKEVEQQISKIESCTSSAQKQEYMMVNNIQRLNSMDTKIADLKVNMDRNEGKIVKNNEMISDVKSSLSEVAEQQQIYTESRDKRASQPSVINTGDSWNINHKFTSFW